MDKRTGGFGEHIVKLDTLYNNRFSVLDQTKKKELWSVLCQNFFQQYVNETDKVLDLAAGYCDFINNITCAEKYAVDINEDVRSHANHNVTVHLAPSTNMESIPDESMDVVFTSNFFEHLNTKQELIATLEEVRRILRKSEDGGTLLILQPNIRFAYREYWDFVDHTLPLSDRSLCEALELAGFTIKKAIPQFMPYSTKSGLPQNMFLVRLYLKIPLAWKFLGKQCFVVAKK